MQLLFYCQKEGKIIFLFIVMLFVCSISFAQSYKLWYDKPAKKWTEALPLGNGRIAAMVYGGTENEIIQFNEETVWTGQPHDYAHKGAYKFLDEIRGLLFAGKQNEAHALAKKEFMSQPFGQQTYQPFGNIELKFPGHEKAEKFYRDLSLENAVATVNYEVNGIKYTRRAFVSFPDQALFVKINASKAGALNFSVSMTCPHSNKSITANGNVLVLKGKANNYPYDYYEKQGNYKYPESKIIFESHLLVQNEGGKVESENGMINVKGATSVTLKLVAATNFVNYKDIGADPKARCEDYLSHVSALEFEKAKKNHVTDYQKLYKRTTIDLGKSDLSERPTNQRLSSYFKDKDPNLVALLYQYGRYLLISSSRPGTQPANLQGIWNDKLVPPWDSKYTVNINTEMNYWPAEMTNLTECTDPLFQMLKELAVTGKVVAKEHYNLNGWILHHNTDLWRGAAPINGADHGIWVGGSGWLCEHLWWHYEYTGDLTFLRETAYPIMKSAAEFYAKYLIPHPAHPEWLVSGPSNSPENGGLVMGPTMDHQIIRNLFENTIEAAHILKVDNDFATMLTEKKSKIVPNQIGRYGQLQEWVEDKDDPKSEHRHVSHLWGLFPGNEISPYTTPELAQACKMTLQHRGDEGTGWSRAWKINFWARLLDGDHAYLILNNLIVPSSNTENVNMSEGGGLYVNMFDAHPPFQIDGNFGATSGITEMILQSHLRNDKSEYYLDILPALPKAFAKGEISGLVARGGFRVSVRWNKSKLLLLTILSRNGNNLNVRYNGKTISLKTQKGKIYKFSLSDFRNKI
jgi:hypothetical protein